jgi:branched-chain amino acid transport system ATP-binding protein
MLTLRNIDVHYGRVHAVRRVSLHVAPGEIVALIGANGAGKTTLLSAISGVQRASAGAIEFNGRDIVREKPERIVRLGLSHVPERRLVFGPLTVEDNLLLGAYSRFKRREAEADMEEIYAMFPVLCERRRQQAGALSGGEQQMLAIGRALMAGRAVCCWTSRAWGLLPRCARRFSAMWPCCGRKRA